MEIRYALSCADCWGFCWTDLSWLFIVVLKLLDSPLLTVWFAPIMLVFVLPNKSIWLLLRLCAYSDSYGCSLVSSVQSLFIILNASSISVDSTFRLFFTLGSMLWCMYLTYSSRGRRAVWFISLLGMCCVDSMAHLVRRFRIVGDGVSLEFVIFICVAGSVFTNLRLSLSSLVVGIVGVWLVVGLVMRRYVGSSVGVY